MAGQQHRPEAQHRPVHRRVGQVGHRRGGAERLATVGGPGREPTTGTAGVQQQRTVGQLAHAGLVQLEPLVAAGDRAERCCHPPGLPVVVAECARHRDPPGHTQHERLHQPARERPGGDRAPGPGGGEHPGDPLPGQVGIPGAAQHAGQPPVRPGAAGVGGDGQVAVLDVRVRIRLRLPGLEEPGPLTSRVECQHRSRDRVHEQRRVTEAGEPGAGAHHLRGGPGEPAVGGPAHQEVDRSGQVVQVRTAVVGAQQHVADRGQRGDAVLPVAALAAAGQHPAGGLLSGHPAGARACGGAHASAADRSRSASVRSTARCSGR